MKYYSCLALDGLQILVVDYDQDSRDLLTILFAGYGINTLTAASAKETACASDQDRLEALAAGFCEYLIKPFDFEKLISTIAYLMPHFAYVLDIAF